MFITTANVLQTIPAPLQDRMEVIRIAGYTEPEKLNIAKRFLVSKEMEANGLRQGQPCFYRRGDLLTIIRQYTREAGVRNLEREIASICRKVAREIVTNGNKRTDPDLLPRSHPEISGCPEIPAWGNRREGQHRT